MSTDHFQELVDQQYALVYRFALSLAKSEADAADLTQQTFFLWASKGDQLRDRSKARSWLFTTLYREFLGRRRHEVRFPKVELDDVREQEMSISPNVNVFDSTTVLQALRNDSRCDVRGAARREPNNDAEGPVRVVVRLLLGARHRGEQTNGKQSREYAPARPPECSQCAHFFLP